MSTKLWPYLNNFQPLADCICNRLKGSSESAVVNRNQNRGVIDHIAVSFVHAVFSILMLNNGFIIALVYQVIISPSLALAPELRLLLTGNCGLKRYLIMLSPQSYDCLTEVHIRPDGHAADVMPYTRII